MPADESARACDQDPHGYFLAGPVPLEVGVHHHAHEPREVHLGLPAQLRLRLGGVAEQVVHFGGAHEGGVGDHVILPVQAHVGEGQLEELPHRVVGRRWR